MKTGFKKIMAILFLCATMVLGTVVVVSAEEGKAVDGPYNITVQPGTDETQIGLNWIVDGRPTSPVVQIVRAEFALLTGGAFPEAYATTVPAVATETTFTAKTSDGGSVKKYSVKASVTGLSHLTEYLYRVGEEGNWSKAFSYKTPAKKNFRSMLLSDIHMIEHEEWQRDLFVSGLYWEESLQYYKDNYDFSLILSLGDQFQDSRKSEYFDEFLSNDNVNSHALAVINGNHDVSPASPNLNVFFNQVNQVEGTAKHGIGDYYFKFGKALFIMLNISEAPENNDYDHSIVFKNAVEACPDYEWLIVTAHYPIYGPSSTVADATRASIYASYKQVIDLIDEYDADLYISGHTHCYGRSYVMKGDDITEEAGASDTYVDADGTIYLTVGAATEMWELWISENTIPNDWLKKNKDKIPTYQIMDISGNKLTIESYDLKKKKLIDTFTLIKSDIAENDGVGEEAEPFTHPDLEEYYKNNPVIPEDSGSDSAPQDSTPTSNSTSSSKKGCGGSASASTVIFGGMFMAAYALLKKKR